MWPMSRTNALTWADLRVLDARVAAAADRTLASQARYRALMESAQRSLRAAEYRIASPHRPMSPRSGCAAK